MGTDKIHLKRQISLSSAVALLVGSIIASGIFIAPKGVLAGTQSVGLCLIVWLGCGLVALSGSLCYCELGTLISKSGSDYAYLLEVYGSYPAFLYCISFQFFVVPSSGAIVSMTAAKYVGAPIFGNCGPSNLFVKSLASFLLLSCGIVNAANMKASLIGTKLFTFLKLVAASSIIVIGLVTLGRGKFDGFDGGFSGSAENPGDIASACYNALFAYNGWQGLNNVTEELKNHKKNLPLAITISVLIEILVYALMNVLYFAGVDRNLPRAIIVSVLIVILVYVSMNVSYFAVLGPGGVLTSDSVAVSFEKEALSTNFIFSIGVAFSTTGNLLASILTYGRIPYVAAREGHLPEFLSFVHISNVTPFIAIMFKTTCSIILIFLGDVTSLINFLSILTWVFIGLNIVGLIIMRFTKKGVHRPYKVPIVLPVLMVFVALFLVSVPLIFSPRLEYLLAVGVLAVATLFYVPFIYFKKSLPFMDKLTMWVQLVVQVAPSAQNTDD